MMTDTNHSAIHRTDDATMTIEAPVFDRLAAMLADVIERLNTVSEPDEVLNVKEASQLLRIGVNEVRGLARGGYLPGVKLGNGWRFSRKDLLEWLRQQARANTVHREGAER